MQRDQVAQGSSTSNLEKRHASLLGLYIVIGEGINTSLLKYYKVLRSNYSGPVHVVQTTTITGQKEMTLLTYVMRLSGGDKQIE